MNRTKPLEWAARIIAIAIIVAGIIDPEITLSRKIRPVIELHATDSAASAALIGRLKEQINRVGVVIWGSTPGATARVVVGSKLVEAASTDTIPRFVVPTPIEGGFHVEDIILPTVAPLDSRVPVKLLVSRESSATVAKAKLALELREANVLVADTVVEMSGGERTTITLPYVPSDSGLHKLDLLAFPADGGVNRVSSNGRRMGSLHWERFVYANKEAWTVLFFDARPSWLSTFVRRALARDERFKVASRVVTSTGVSLATPRAASDLSVLEQQTSLPDVLVVGAPEALSAGNKASLLRLVKDRGLQVILLPDHAVSTAAGSSAGSGAGSDAGNNNELPGFDAWRSVGARPADSPHGITWPSAVGSDSLRLYSATPAVPQFLATEAIGLAFMTTRNSTGSGAIAHPVIWTQAVGLGEVLVSGAFDAWRYRDRGPTDDYTDFEAAWQDLAGRMAQRRHRTLALIPAPVQPWGLELHPSRAHVVLRSSRGNTGGGSGQSSDLKIGGGQRGTIQDSSKLRIVLNARSDEPDTLDATQVLPTLLRDENQIVRSFKQGFSPTSLATITAIQGADTVKAPLYSGLGPTDVPIEQLQHWTKSVAGGMVTDDITGTGGSFDSLVEAITKATPLSVQPYPWYPLRSPWWIVPLAVALATEWWLRRRRGLS